MLITPKPGARLGLNDPLCHVKSTEELISETSPPRENYRPNQTLCSQVQEKNDMIPQAEDKPSRKNNIA